MTADPQDAEAVRDRFQIILDMFCRADIKAGLAILDDGSRDALTACLTAVNRDAKLASRLASVAAIAARAEGEENRGILD